MDEKTDIPGYEYGSARLGHSPVSLAELQQLKITVGMTLETEDQLRLAGEVLADQTEQIVEHWRSSIIASIPYLVYCPSRNWRTWPLELNNLRVQRSNFRCRMIDAILPGPRS